MKQIRIFALLLGIVLVMIYLTPGFGETRGGLQISDIDLNEWYHVRVAEVASDPADPLEPLAEIVPHEQDHVSIYRIALDRGSTYTLQWEHTPGQRDGYVALVGWNPLTRAFSTSAPTESAALMPLTPASCQALGPGYVLGQKKNFRVSQQSQDDSAWLVITAGKPDTTVRFRMMYPAEEDSEVRERGTYWIRSDSTAQELVPAPSQELWLGSPEKEKAPPEVATARYPADHPGAVTPRAKDFARDDRLLPLHASLSGAMDGRQETSAHLGPLTSRSTGALWIEAEEESAFHITSQCSGERTAIPHFGESYWSLDGEGDWVEYSIEIPKEQMYYIWLRHFDDVGEGPSHRDVRVAMNGITMSTVPDHPGSAREAWGWTRVGWGHMAKDHHVLRITKSRATHVPALIDAIFITPDGNAQPPELASKGPGTSG